jgi:hypothetical protein
MSESKMQADFEAWHRSVVEGEPPHEKYDSGDYLNQHVQRYWTGWKASRESLVIELSDLSNCFSPDDCGDWAIWLDDVKKLIVAAGLKVAQ